MDSMRDEQKKCGFCGEEVPDGQRRCPYCGSLPAIREVVNTVNIANTTNAANTSNTINRLQGSDTENGTYPAANANKLNIESPAVQETVGKGETRPQPVSPLPYPQQGYPQAGSTNPAAQRLSTGYPAGSGTVGKPLGNGLKVLLTVLFTVIPGIGQIAGAITALILMSYDGDRDKKSFGTALLIASMIMFAVMVILSFLAAVTFPMLVK